MFSLELFQHTGVGNDEKKSAETQKQEQLDKFNESIVRKFIMMSFLRAMVLTDCRSFFTLEIASHE
jgi:hypothetical protein